MQFLVTRRGDTLIEVMFATAIFSLVAIISLAIINLGVANVQSDLEAVTARSELNAQAEALRFLHSSYVSENTLPLYNSLVGVDPTLEKHQQYTDVWRAIISHAIAPSEMTLKFPIDACSEVYHDDDFLLKQNKAFVINTHNLLLNDAAVPGRDLSDIYVDALGSPDRFREAGLGARIIYANDSGVDQDYNGDDFTYGEGNILGDAGRFYSHIAVAEGIWVIAVKNTEGDATPTYYDFYIQACWYGPNAKHASTLDSVIRLYNPEGVRI